MYLNQTYDNVELILFNTDTENLYYTDQQYKNLVIVNNSIDYNTGVEYTSRGQICRDAVTHAAGDLFMLMDDDDLYMPWHVQQAVDMITLRNSLAWKPQYSFFRMRDKLELTKNTMEASVIVNMDFIRQTGFNEVQTGLEGLTWYTKLRDMGELVENDQYNIPSYCFNWGDSPEWGWHKQSGDINNPKNFDNHKNNSTDIVSGPLVPLYTDDLEPIKNYYKMNYTKYPPELVDKYGVIEKDG